ncbi:MAG TPA: DMT family transporter [Burkholderiales bacterium]|jgi:drug/metabolite transporter (DMT)-like permease
MSIAVWLWIPITLAAAFSQTLRNAAQRHISGAAGLLPATFVRFAFGLPFAVLWLLFVTRVLGMALPPVSWTFLGWVAIGAFGQLFATALLLAAMGKKAFVVAVAYSKTEVLQIVVLSAVLISERVTGTSLTGILIASVGIFLLSVTPKAAGGSPEERRAQIAGVLLGLASGTLFAASTVGYRAGSLHLNAGAPLSPLMAGAFGLVWAQSMQSVALGAWLAWRQPQSLLAVARTWKLSLATGFAGALASACWLTAFAMHNVADVRALGMIEIVFAHFISHGVFRERLKGRELAGIALLLSGLVLLCLAM